MIEAAMAEWEEYTCLDFREKTASDTNYVKYFSDGNG